MLLIYLLLLLFTPNLSSANQEDGRFIFEEGVVFATTADTEHYPILLMYIESIHRHHPTNLREIIIFDIGFTSEERLALNKMHKVHVYDIEHVNDCLFTKFRTRLTGKGKYVRGLYSWKPVAIKQALEMYPYVYYIDSALCLQQPADILFEYIKQNGYLLLHCGHEINFMYTQTGERIFSLDNPELNWVKGRSGISAGIQGLSRSLFDSYVMPIYELSHDINNFVDDGTAPDGFGCGRHDQLLYSIKAQLLGLNIVPEWQEISVNINGTPVHFRVIDYIPYKPAWWGARFE